MKKLKTVQKTVAGEVIERTKAETVSAKLLPTVTKGSHLTVYTYQDGRTTLEWDDEQLLKEVREAIASVNSQNQEPTKKAKSSTKKAPAKKTVAKKKGKNE